MHFDTKEFVTKKLWTREEIQVKAKEIVKDIESDPSYSPENSVFIAILDGAINFFSDLTMELSDHVLIDNIRASSYKGTEQSDSVAILKDISHDITGKTVYLVDEIFDTGNTFAKTKEYLMSKGAREIKEVVMIYKPHTRKVDFEPTHVAFEMNTDDWLVGYGLDCNGCCRNLPYVGVVSEAGIKFLMGK